MRFCLYILVGLTSKCGSRSGPSAYTVGGCRHGVEVSGLATDIHRLGICASERVYIKVHIVESNCLDAFAEFGIVVFVVVIPYRPNQGSLATTEVGNSHRGIVPVGDGDCGALYRCFGVDRPLALSGGYRQIVCLHSVGIHADVIIGARIAIHLTVVYSDRYVFETARTIEIPIELGVAIRKVFYFKDSVVSVVNFHNIVLIISRSRYQKCINSGIVGSPVTLGNTFHRLSFEFHVGNTLVEHVRIGENLRSIRLVGEGNFIGSTTSNSATSPCNSPFESNQRIGIHA